MIEEDLRDRILAAPERLLDDQDLMSALVSANERRMGDNIVDLRGVFIQRLETRLERLEDTHRSVIAAAYDNLAGTNQIHRAILKLLEPVSFDVFLQNLAGPVCEILQLDDLRLVLESRNREDLDELRNFEHLLQVVEPEFCQRYIHQSERRNSRNVTLRAVSANGFTLYGRAAARLGSEALLKLDFGTGRLPGMLVMASADPHQFRPNQGTDLLAFFAAIFQLTMRRWLQ